MTDRWTDTELTGRLRSIWTSELARAQADFPSVPSRAATRPVFVVPGAVIAVTLAVLALAIVLRGIGLPPTGSNDIQIGDDGLPVAIGGETVLRGDQITQWLTDPSATGSVLAGGRLVVYGTGCSNAPSDTECTESWQLVPPTGDGPSFDLQGVAEAAGFVRTSGALTVLRVERGSCRSVPCPEDLMVSDVPWRAPTKGRIPANASAADGSSYLALWPDFVGTYGSDGETIAGYVAKADLLAPHDGPLPVYGEDLTTLVGYQVPERGFVPIGEYQASTPPSALAIDATAVEVLTAYLEAVKTGDCPAALAVAASGNIVPTTNALCSSSVVTAFEVGSSLTQPSGDAVIIRVSLTTGRGAFSLPDGPNAWFFTLTRQSDGAWRVSGGAPRSTESSATPVPDGITQSAAEAAAIQAVGRSNFSAVNAVAGRAGDVIFDGMPFHDLPSDETMVWFITLADGTGMGAQGAFVVVDYFDGTVYGYQFWIS